jgi:5-methylcytosine-specific restriction endonuclease McrA
MIETSNTEMVNKRFDIWSRRLIEILGYPGNVEPRMFSYELKKNLFDANPTCSICNQKLYDIDDCEVDHIEQYWKGGKTIPENARLTHRYCNRQRGKGI